MKIAARKSDWPKERESVEIEYPMPETLEAAVAKFGDSVVYNKMVDSVTIDVQSNMRRILSNEKTTQEQKDKALAELVDYVPTAASSVRRTPTEKVGDLVLRMSKEEKEALVKKLREELKAAATA